MAIFSKEDYVGILVRVGVLEKLIDKLQDRLVTAEVAIKTTQINASDVAQQNVPGSEWDIPVHTGSLLDPEEKPDELKQIMDN